MQDSPVRSQEPPDRTWTLGRAVDAALGDALSMLQPNGRVANPSASRTLIRTLSSQQQHLAAVRDTPVAQNLSFSWPVVWVRTMTQTRPFDPKRRRDVFRWVTEKSKPSIFGQVKPLGLFHSNFLGLDGFGRKRIESTRLD